MDPTAATSEIMKLGLPGAAIILLMIVCGALWKAYHSTNEARIKEGDESMTRYISLLERVMSSMSDTNTILQIVKDRMGSRSKND